MVSRIIIFALIVGVVYLNYTTPKTEDHKAFLLAEMNFGFALDEELQERIWRKTDYSNFFVCSFVRDTKSNALISYGFLKTVRLNSDDWVKETKAEILRLSNY